MVFCTLQSGSILWSPLQAFVVFVASTVRLFITRWKSELKVCCKRVNENGNPIKDSVPWWLRVDVHERTRRAVCTREVNESFQHTAHSRSNNRTTIYLQQQQQQQQQQTGPTAVAATRSSGAGPAARVALVAARCWSLSRVLCVTWSCTPEYYSVVRERIYFVGDVCCSGCFATTRKKIRPLKPRQK